MIISKYHSGLSNYQIFDILTWFMSFDILIYHDNQWKRWRKVITSEHVNFLVDIFHVSKHTEELCTLPENPNCLYHPHLNKLRGVNTKLCDQGFLRLSQCFEFTRKMIQYQRNALFCEWF